MKNRKSSLLLMSVLETKVQANCGNPVQVQISIVVTLSCHPLDIVFVFYCFVGSPRPYAEGDSRK